MNSVLRYFFGQPFLPRKLNLCENLIESWLAENDIIITCVSEDGDFAKMVSDYLCNELTSENQNNPGKRFHITSDSVMVEGDEIHVSPSSLIPKNELKKVLQSLLSSDPVKFRGYAVIELGDTFTVGKILPADSGQSMAVCEICGYFTPYEEELYTHRMTHLAGFP